ncbi:hypothetical protein BC835DRAFT_1311027 [Cytidiella melzeri]|nr:hypothetical protein BC835DRAFT_1311027 [Cytidiella melzeri]
MFTTTTTTRSPLTELRVFWPQGQRRRTQTTVTDLPNELLLDIACYLPLRALIALRNVSLRWRAVISAASESGLPETTKKLLEAWIASAALRRDLPGADSSQPAYLLKTEGSTQGSSSSARTLTDAQREQYVSIIGRYALSYQSVSQEEPGLSDEFLTWLYEWPSHAGLSLPPLPLSYETPETMANQVGSTRGVLSPSSVVNSIVHSASYCTSRGSGLAAVRATMRPSYYYQGRIVFLIALEDNDILLPRVKLALEEVPPPGVAIQEERHEQQERPRQAIKCSMLPGGPHAVSTFRGDWARFLPISTVRCAGVRNNGIEDEDDDVWEVDTDPKAPLPLYVLSGSGLGETLTGNVCMLEENGVLRVVARSWADYLLVLASLRKQELKSRKFSCMAKAGPGSLNTVTAITMPPPKTISSVGFMAGASVDVNPLELARQAFHKNRGMSGSSRSWCWYAKLLVAIVVGYGMDKLLCALVCLVFSDC